MNILKTVSQQTNNILKHGCLTSRINEILRTKPTGQIIHIKGWVKSVRKMKGLTFVDVNDGSCCKQLQVLYEKSKGPKSLLYGSSVSVTGQLKTNDNGQLELLADEFNLLGDCKKEDNFPFTPKQKHPPDYCRQFLHLRPRTNSFASLLRIRHKATQLIHDHFQQNNFYNVHTPVLTSNDCEGAGEVFTVLPENKDLLKQMEKESVEKENAFFDTKAFLTVSGQLHLETVVRGLSKVYSFGPTFRAENSKSRLHLSEFYMIEAEESFTQSLSDILETMEKLVKGVTESIYNTCKDDMETILKYNDDSIGEHFQKLENLISKPFTVMSHEEAVSIVKRHEKEFQTRVDDDGSFAKEHELFLVAHNNGTPIFVIDWPKISKPFYMKETDYDTNKVHAVDLLVPNVGELCGGSLREDSYNILEKKLEEHSLSKVLDWYLELRKFGNVPTGGFGLGFERYLQFILNIENIKDTIPFPRWPHNLSL